MKTKYNSINNLLSDPSQISEVMTNPAKFGLDFWNELSNNDKKYIALAGAAGLAMYGLYLGRQNDSGNLGSSDNLGKLNSKNK